MTSLPTGRPRVNDAAIGVFDSGIGGLTVVTELKRQLPNERILYLGDTARLPYGTKSPVTIQHYSLQNASFLLQRGIKLLVVACNTASAWAIDQLSSYSPVPVIGVIEPGCLAAASVSHRGRIGVIGTNATIRSEAYPAMLKKLLPGTKVFSKACPLLVPLVEEGWLDHRVTTLVIAEYLEELKKADVDTLVLGCTHYPLLKKAFRTFLGDEVNLVCSSEAVAQQVKTLLDKEELRGNGRPEPDCFYLTDHSVTFQRIMTLFLGKEVREVEQVEIGSARDVSFRKDI